MFNEEIVKQQIVDKLNYNKAYYGRKNFVRNIVTDMDSFPYTRYFRGSFSSDKPIIFGREAGWRLLDNKCYTPVLTYMKPMYPNHCFQTACSTVYPCIPAYEPNGTAIDLGLNHTIVNTSL